MDRWGVAILSGVLGGIAGGAAVRYLTPAPAAPPAAAEAAPSREVAEQLTEIRRLLDRPPAVSPSSGAPAGGGGAGLRAGAGGAPAGSDAAGGAVPTAALTPSDLQALAERAAEAALDRREKKEKETSKAPAVARMPLSDIAREMGLSSGQESDLREAYRSRTERFLKVLAAPDGDPEAVRRELTEAKGDPEQIEAVKAKYIPKILAKLGDVVAIETETAARVNKALGSKENVAKYKKFTPEEQDPFGLDGSITVTSTDR